MSSPKPLKTVKAARPGVTLVGVCITVAATIFVTAILKSYIKSDASPFPSHWADMA